MELQVQAEDGAATQTLPTRQSPQAASQLVSRGRNALNLLEHRAQAARLAAEVLQLRSALLAAEAGQTEKLEQWLDQFDDTPHASNQPVSLSQLPATKPSPLAPHGPWPQSQMPAWESYLPAARSRLADIEENAWPWERRFASAQSNTTQSNTTQSNTTQSIGLLGEAAVASCAAPAPETDGCNEEARVSSRQDDSVRLDDLVMPAAEDNRSTLLLDDVLSAAEDSRSTRQPKRVWGSFSFSLVGHGLLFLALGTITYRHQDQAAASLGSQVLEAMQASSEEPELGNELELTEPQTAAAAQEMMATPSTDTSLALSELSAASSPTSLGDVMGSQSAASSIASAVGRSGATSGTSATGGGRAGRGAPSMSGAFFGVGTGGNYFCYVVDSSGSMRGQAWESAKLELMRSLSSLKPTQQFYIVFFDHQMHAIPEPGHKQPATHGLFATKENIDHARRWMETVQLSRGGPPSDALAWAIEREPDAIYLLTDGVTKVDVCGAVRKVNQIEDWISGPRVRVPIHPIAYHSLDGQQLMRQLADENKGQFHYVPKPQKP